MDSFEHQPTDPTYERRSNPPQEPSEVFICSECSVPVINPQQHTLAVHRTAEQEVSVAQRQGDPRQSEGRL